MKTTYFDKNGELGVYMDVELPDEVGEFIKSEADNQTLLRGRIVTPGDIIKEWTMSDVRSGRSHTDQS